MIHELKRRFWCADGFHVGGFHALDHYHLDAERVCGRDLGVGSGATGILADDDIDLVLPQQAGFIALVERSAREDVAAVRHIERRNDRVDATDQIGMLWRRRELAGFLPPDRQEHTARSLAQRTDCARDIGHGKPSVSFLPLPTRTAKCEDRRPGTFGGFSRIGRNLVREGVRGIDQQIHPFVSQVTNESIDAAKAADSRRQGQGFRIHGAAGKRNRRLDIPARRQTLGQLPRFRRAAEDQYAVLAHG